MAGAEHVDHKAEALRQLGSLREYAREAEVPAEQRIGVAQVHASLALAEGQERVANAVEQLVEDGRKRRGEQPLNLGELIDG